MPYFLGVDAGGTKTEFLLGDEDRELGRVRTGSIKRLRRDAAATQQNLSNALDELTVVSGVSLLSIARCCVGAAGVTAPLVAGWITQAFRPLVGGDFLLVEDVEIALDAAFQGGCGVLILAGTGSNVAGRGADGRIVTAGGWGPALSDEGSGYFLGIEALRRGFRAIDEQRPSILLDAIRKHWQLAALGDLLEFANASPGPEFSQLAPLVVECAVEGDAVALEVIQHGSAELSVLAELVIERIARAERSSGNMFTVPPIALAGSILEKVPIARQAMEDALRLRYPEAAILEKAADPVQGALWRARQDK